MSSKEEKIDHKLTKITFYAKDPTKLTNKRITKSFSLKKYTEEEAERMGKEWKEKMNGMGEGRNNREGVFYPVVHVENDIDLKLAKDTGTSTIIFGSSKTGKSTLYIYLYNKYFKKDSDNIALLFSPNYHVLSRVSSKNKLPKSLITSYKFDPNLINDMQRINHRVNNKYEFLVCMDDVVDRKENTMVRNLILTYRNANISSIICLQDCTLLAKNQRNNANNIIFFAFRSDENIKDTIERYFLSYLKDYPSIESKINWYKENTMDHKFIYLNTLDNTFSFHKLPQEKIGNF